MRLTIRSLNKEDIDKVTELIARLKDLNSELDPHYTTVEDLDEISRKYIENSIDNPNVIFLVAEDTEKSRIVGILRAQLVERPFYKPNKALLITDIYVDPRYRRRGLGTLLLEKLENEARKRDIEMIIASYPSGNVIADDFFTKKGFKPLQVEKYKHLE